MKQKRFGKERTAAGRFSDIVKARASAHHARRKAAAAREEFPFVFYHI